MDKEIIDVIDTAVKIGLGALISGASAYFLTNSKYEKEKEKEKYTRTVNFLKDISLKIEEAKHAVEAAAHPYWHHAVDNEALPYSEATKESIDLYLKAISIIGQARALTCLVSLPDLKNCLDKAEIEIQDLYHSTVEKNVIDESEEMNKKLEALKPIFSQCFYELGEAYKNA